MKNTVLKIVKGKTKKRTRKLPNQLLELTNLTLSLSKAVNQRLCELFKENEMLKNRMQKLENKWKY